MSNPIIMFLALHFISSHSSLLTGEKEPLFLDQAPHTLYLIISVGVFPPYVCIDQFL